MFRSKEYLEFIRLHSCAITGYSDNVVAHHVRLGASAGTGQKPSDLMTVPITQTLHLTLHSMGEKSFWERHGLDPHELVFKYISEYFKRLGMFTWRQSLTALENVFEKNKD